MQVTLAEDFLKMYVLCQRCDLSEHYTELLVAASFIHSSYVKKTPGQLGDLAKPEETIK
jgi:hypothetical protein